MRGNEDCGQGKFPRRVTKITELLAEKHIFLAERSSEWKLFATNRLPKNNLSLSFRAKREICLWQKVKKKQIHRAKYARWRRVPRANTALGMTGLGVYPYSVEATKREHAWNIRVKHFWRRIQGTLIPLRRAIKMNLDDLLEISDVEPVAVGFPALCDNLNENAPDGRLRDMGDALHVGLDVDFRFLVFD
jgi:hypothetical protein